ncbi:MAG: hypothetical protein GX882_05155 [Methanomicrobiales archaeon]|nr:hypothetical protein [Methanomicrobiales archaeon]
MTSRKTYIQEIARQLSGFLATGSAEDLAIYMVAESSPDLARAFADTVREYAAADEGDSGALWDLCIELAWISPVDAPAGDPREILPLCGVLGIAAIGGVAPEFTGMALARLQDISCDPRRRVRESVALGVSDLLAARQEETIAGLEGWVLSGSWLSMRAAAAGIAESDLLVEPGLAEAALSLHRKILIRVYTAGERQSEAFIALKRVLGHTLGRVVMALPGIGFEYLRQLATLDDRDVRWIVRENLESDVLRRRYPETVRHIQARLALH